MGATERIINRLVPEWIQHQEEKAKDYNSEFADGFSDGVPVGFENADVLGVPGQFAEIWRKIWKLKRGMWDGATLVNEPVREILLDLIGHCFLAIDMIDRKDMQHVEESINSLIEPTEKRRVSCGSACAQGHTFIGLCTLRRTNKRDS